MLWALNLCKFISAHMWFCDTLVFYFSFSLLFALDRATLSTLEILSVMHGYLQTTWYRSQSTYLCWLPILCQWWMKIRCHFWFFWMCQLPPVLLTMNWPALCQSGSKDKWDELWSSESCTALSPGAGCQWIEAGISSVFKKTPVDSSFHRIF